MQISDCVFYSVTQPAPAGKDWTFVFLLPDKKKPEGGSLCVEASTLNGIITLCIENKAEMPGLAGMIRTAFEKEDITVLEAVDLDT